MKGLRSLISSTHNKKRIAKKGERAARKLREAEAMGDHEDVVKYSARVARADAARDAYVAKFRVLAEAAERYNGFGSMDHRKAVATLIRKAAKVGVVVESPDFSKKPPKAKAAAA